MTTMYTLPNGEKTRTRKPKMPYGPDHCRRCGAYAMQYWGGWAEPYCQKHLKKS